VEHEEGAAMSTLEKLKEKFNEKPIPNNISFDEVERLAKSYGCRVVSGGNIQKRSLTYPAEL